MSLSIPSCFILYLSFRRGRKNAEVMGFPLALSHTPPSPPPSFKSSTGGNEDMRNENFPRLSLPLRKTESVTVVENESWVCLCAPTHHKRQRETDSFSLPQLETHLQVKTIDSMYANVKPVTYNRTIGLHCLITFNRPVIKNKYYCSSHMSNLRKP